MNRIIKHLCPRCGENPKRINRGTKRTSPFQPLCQECSNLDLRLKRAQNRRVREFMENMRTL